MTAANLPSPLIGGMDGGMKDQGLSNEALENAVCENWLKFIMYYESARQPSENVSTTIEHCARLAAFPLAFHDEK